MHTLQAPLGVTIAWCETPLERRQHSRRMLHELIFARFGDEVDLIQQCAVCGSDAHGPLRVQLRVSPKRPDPGQAPLVSVSYAGALTVVGVAPPGATSFGIDVEFDNPATRQAVTEALGAGVGAGTPAEPPTVRDWTRLEATVKADGRGLRGDWEAQGVSVEHLSDGHVCFDLTIPSSPEVAILSIALT